MAMIGWRSLLGGRGSARRSGRRPVGRFERLEPRMLLSGDPIVLGPQTSTLLTSLFMPPQPHVQIELIDEGTGLGPYGGIYDPLFAIDVPYNRFLLDTGANSVISAADATIALVTEDYQTEGSFHELGVAGYTEYDISAAYQLDFWGSDGVRHTLPQTEDQVRILSSETEVLGGELPLGKAGIVGMPGMAGRVTTLETGSDDITLDLYGGSSMPVTFSDTLSAGDGNRYSVAVDNRVAFYPEEGLPENAPEDAPLPVWAPVPFMTGVVEYQGNVEEGTFLLDTGAQYSIISTDLATAVGLDENCNGDLTDEAIFMVEIGGVGGNVRVPLLLIDAFHLHTEQGVDLTWRNTDPEALGVEVLVMDIAPGIEGVLGVDMLTAGVTFDLDINTFEVILLGNAYFDQVHFDFRDMMNGSGMVHFDLYPYRAEIAQSGGSTRVVEGGPADTYDVVLRTQPAEDVTVYLSTYLGEVTAVDDADPDNNFLVFTPLDWDLPHTVRVTAADDGFPEGLHQDMITHQVISADPNYDEIRVAMVSVGVAESETAEVVGRHVFYNNSAFDGNDEDANARNNCAIAPDKQALLPGQTATFANYTSYASGINGIMIDMAGLADPEQLDAADFVFRVGNDDDPSGWTPAPPPREISVAAGAGDGLSDRVTILWDDGAVVNQWAQITMLDTERTGLLAPDVFYFGNAVGETGNSGADAKVNAVDALLARNNPRSLTNPAPIDFPYDYDRDARVNATDMLLARNNQTHLFDALKLITVPAGKAAQASPETSNPLGQLPWLSELEQAQDRKSPPAEDEPGSISEGEWELQ